MNKPSSFDFRTDKNDRTDRDSQPQRSSGYRPDYPPRERGRTPYRENGPYNRPSTPYYDRNFSRERDSSGNRYQPRSNYDTRRNDYQPRSYSNNGYRNNRDNSYNRPYNRDSSYNRRDNSYNRRDNSYNRNNSRNNSLNRNSNNRDSYNRSYQRDGYNQRSTSKDRAQFQFKERSYPDPKTEKMTFTNDEKMVYLTIVEKPNLN